MSNPLCSNADFLSWKCCVRFQISGKFSVWNSWAGERLGGADVLIMASVWSHVCQCLRGACWFTEAAETVTDRFPPEVLKADLW